MEFIALTITAMVPFLFVAQGTMLSGRAGIFNVAQEGLMLLGAAVGYLVSLKAGSNIAGLLGAAVAGAVVGAVLAWATTSLRMDQFVVGLALFFLAGGAASLLYRVVIGQDEPPRIKPLPDLLLIVTPTSADIPIFRNRLTPQGAVVVTGLGKVAYQTTVASVPGRGPIAEVAWLSGNNRLMTLRFTTKVGTPPSEATALAGKLVELAKRVDQIGV